MTVLQCIPLVLLVVVLSRTSSYRFSDNRGWLPTHRVDRSQPWGQRLINSYREQQVNDRISDNAQAQLLPELQVNSPRTEKPGTKRQRSNSETLYCELEDESPNKKRKVEGGTDEGDDCDDDDVLSLTKQAECKPKYLLCDIPTEPSTGQGKK